MICEECGSDGEGGEIEYSDGKVYHFRKEWPKDGTIRPIMCAGKFVERVEGRRQRLHRHLLGMIDLECQGCGKHDFKDGDALWIIGGNLTHWTGRVDSSPAEAKYCGPVLVIPEGAEG